MLLNPLLLNTEADCRFLYSVAVEWERNWLSLWHVWHCCLCHKGSVKNSVCISS